jgi:hypothetical protein
MSAFKQQFVSLLIVIFLVILILVVGIQDITAGGATTQSEFSSSSGSGGDMIDPFTGDFKYSIPLFSMGGYPINLGYNAGINMQEDAGWVGLGWNLNPGSVTRAMRGLPDDFSGDTIRKEFTIKPYRVHGYTSNVKVDITIPIYFVDIGVNPTVNWTEADDSYEGKIYGFGGGLGTSIGITAGAFNISGGFNWGANYNTAAGYNSSITPFISAGAFGVSAGVSGGLLNRNSRTGQKISGVNLAIGFAGMVGVGYSWHTLPSSALSTSVPMSMYEFTKKEYSKSTQAYVGAFGNGIGGGTEKFDNETKVKRKYYQFGGRGYLYAGNTQLKKGIGLVPISDYNSINLVETFSPETQLLPQPQATADIFIVSNQQGGGIFRPERTDVGIYSVPYSSNTSFQPKPDAGKDLDIKISIPIWGWGNIKKSFFHSSIKKPWSIPLKDKVFFKSSPVAREDLISLKSLSDITSQSSTFINTMFGEKLLKPNIGTVGDSFNVDGFNGIIATDNWNSNQNIKRKEVLNYLTAEEAQYVGRTKHLRFWMKNLITGIIDPKIESRIDTIRRGHHLSELQFIDNGGRRFIYGIPAYSLLETNHNFSVNTNPAISHNSFPSLTSYTDKEDSITNESGKENLYMSSSVPAYASHYLLTEVLAGNYIDNTDNGCSDDDYGDFVKFDYQKMNSIYKWRLPLSSSVNQAYVDKGLYSNIKDDKASYSYGEKELWYMYSMESKDEIAFFYLSERLDARPVKNKKGELNSITGNGDGQQKLDSIKIYSKYEWKAKGPNNAIPIQRIHFEYNYELCPQTPNSITTNKGKLTLKALYFTYGNDYSGKEHKYQFDYKLKDSKSNIASYNIEKIDRWGSYKEKPASDTIFPYNLPHNEFPFTYQNDITNHAAAIWNLNKIGLPTGGTIEVEYESDAYAFVQDKKARQMYKIAGFVSEKPADNKLFYPKEVNANYNPSDLWDKETNIAGIAQNTSKSRRQSNFIVVELPDTTISAYENIARVLEMGSGRKEDVFFSIVAKMDANRPERVNGFAKVIRYGRILNKHISPQNMPDSAYSKYMFIETNFERKDNDQYNDDRPPSAMSYYTWQFALREYSKLVYNTENIDNWWEHGKGSSRDIDMDVLGTYTIMEKEGIGRNVILDRSWVRLGAAQGFRYGGGHRVKKIKVKDNWNNLTGTEQSHEYVQEYKYETEDGLSSGVASYEPSVGNEENPFKTIVHEFVQGYKDGPDKIKDVIGPLCENYYPNPMVGYSRVVVSTPSYSDSIRGNGSVVYEFFTNKDYPFIVDSNSKKSFKPVTYSPKSQGSLSTDFLSFPIAPNNSSSRNTFAATQGYKINTNDFHGKLKRVAYLDDNNTTINSVDISYSKNNEFKVLSKTGDVESQSLGKKIDVALESYHEEDLREKGYKTKTWKVFLIVPIRRTRETSVKEYTEISYLTNVKSINQTAIPESITFSENGISYSVCNRLWDKETGDVVMKTVSTKYTDSLYQLSIPAYYAYNEFEPAYSNLRQSGDIAIVNGTTSLGDNLFAQGDELLLSKGIIPDMEYSKAWVLSVTSSTVSIINREGNPVADGTYRYLITRSGNRNRTTENMMQVQSNKYPVTTSGPQKISIDETKKIISASAVEYEDDLKLPFSGYKTPLTEIQTSGTTQLDNAYNDFISDINHLKDSISVYSVIDHGLPGAARYLKIAASRVFRKGLKGAITSEINLPFRIRYAYFSPRRIKEKYSMLSIKVLDGTALDFEHVTFSKTKGSSIDEFGIENDEAIFLFAQDAGGGKHLVRFDCPDMEILNQPSSCGAYSSRDSCHLLADTQVINPFVKGLLNNKQPVRSYAYRTDRFYAQNTSANEFDIRTDGYYNDFAPYWVPGTSRWEKNSTLSKWLNTTTTTLRHQSGGELEIENTLGLPSSQLLGYADNFVVAQASNARYNQIAYDGFEDYDVYQTIKCATCQPERHISFIAPDKSIYEGTLLKSEVKHTGKYSLRFDNAHPAAFTSKYPADPASPVDTTAYNVSQSQRLYGFSPAPGKYLISAWVHKGNNADFSTFSLTVTATNASGSNVYTMPAITSSSNAYEIEGWRKIEFEFNLNIQPQKIMVKFQNASGGDSYHMYLDDFRFMPIDATMKSFVYDKTYNRVMAELDENNYATFHEYDKEGNLIRLKKESVRGLYTTAEFRNNLKK